MSEPVENTTGRTEVPDAATLIDRLRALDAKCSNPPFWTTGIVGEAADEIERLRFAVADRDRLKRRERQIIDAIGNVCDGGHYINDVLESIAILKRRAGGR